MSFCWLLASASGGINPVEGRIRGFFRTESKSYDDLAVRLPIGLTRQLLKVSGSSQSPCISFVTSARPENLSPSLASSSSSFFAASF